MKLVGSRRHGYASTSTAGTPGTGKSKKALRKQRARARAAAAAAESGAGTGAAAGAAAAAEEFTVHAHPGYADSSPDIDMASSKAFHTPLKKADSMDAMVVLGQSLCVDSPLHMEPEPELKSGRGERLSKAWLDGWVFTI